MKVSATATCSVPSGLVTTYPSDGVSRTYLIRVPPGADSNTPMVVSIHGATGSAAGQQETTGFADAAPSHAAPVAPTETVTDAPAEAPVETLSASEVQTMATLGESEGFIAVFPQARAELDYFWDAAPDSADVRFVADLTRYLQSNGCSSPSGTSITGISMGAMMTSRLMCVRSDLYSGAAMVAGALNPLPDCPLPPDREIVVIHGLRDTVVPFDGSLSPTLAALAGEGSDSAVDRLGIAVNWARAKDCSSPGWTTPGPIRVTDLTCPRSATLAVVGETMNHTWNHWGLNTSKLVWASLRPDRACVYSPPSPSNPAMAAALQRLVAHDIAFRVEFGRMLREQMTCNPHVRVALTTAIQTAANANPGGPIAQQVAFAMREKARLGIN